MMLLLIAGMFDLSIGGILAFSGIVAGLMAKDMGMPPLVAFLAGCAWGALLGVVNGIIVTRFKINALIATLATVSIYRGFLQLVSGAGVTNIGNGYTVFGQTEIAGIYSSFWFMAVIVVLFAFLVGRTRYFRQAYYIGGNARAAKLSGINVDRTIFVAFVIMGLLAGLAGALLASRLNTAVVLAGNGVELKVITAVVLGGASLAGGAGQDRRRVPGRAVHGARPERHDHHGHQPLLAAHRGRLRAARVGGPRPVRSRPVARLLSDARERRCRLSIA